VTGPGAPGPPAHRWHDAGDYDELTRLIQRRNAGLLARLHPDPAAVGRAYEVGCGTGTLTAALVRALPAATIEATDISAAMLTRAGAKPWPERVTFGHGSFLELPVGSGYDAVFSNAALHWMHAAYPRVFGKIAGMLRPGGVACLAVAGRTAGTDAFEAGLRDRLPAQVPRTTDFAAARLTADGLAGLAAGAGLAVDDAFVVERTAQLPVEVYARWWLASGGPWAGGEAPPDPVAVISAGLGGPDATVSLVHAAAVAVLHRPAA
jgi:trans-aconitate methyltransferase